jgi:hypothetical protein
MDNALPVQWREQQVQACYQHPLPKMGNDDWVMVVDGGGGVKNDQPEVFWWQGMQSYRSLSAAKKTPYHIRRGLRTTRV